MTFARIRGDREAVVSRARQVGRGGERAAPSFEQEGVAQLHRLDRGCQDSAQERAVRGCRLHLAVVAAFEQHPRPQQVVAGADHHDRPPATAVGQAGEGLRLPASAVRGRVEAGDRDRRRAARAQPVGLRPGRRPAVGDDQHGGDAAADELDPFRQARPSAAGQHDDRVGTCGRVPGRPDEERCRRDRPTEREPQEEQTECAHSADSMRSRGRRSLNLATCLPMKKRCPASAAGCSR